MSRSRHFTYMAAKTNLDPVIVALFAALGLELGCVDRVGGDENDDLAETSSNGGTTGETGEPGETGGTGEPSDTGDTGEPEPAPFECLNPQSIPQLGSNNPSGWVMCDGGFIHREEAVECDVPSGVDECGGCDCGADFFGNCTFAVEASCQCEPGCRTDADCGPGFICVCGGVLPTSDVTQCVPSHCTTSADCGPGLCGISEYPVCDIFHNEAGCAAPDDCHADSDCSFGDCPDPDYGEPGVYECAPSPEGYACVPPDSCNGVCGRPFFVEGVARIAPSRARDDWRARLELQGVAEHERARLVEYWTQIGQFEHASVASFARFCLHLQQLGAPPQLLRETQRALIDEVRHARLAFGLASGYAGTQIGPGPLDMRGSLDKSDVFEIVEGLIREACVGETLAALEAREVAKHAEDPVVAATLEEIAEDELRHALLGWRSLGWILDQSDTSLRSFALACLDDALAGVPEVQGLDRSLRRHGIVDDELRAQVQRRGVQQLIRPCVAALRDELARARTDTSNRSSRRMPVAHAGVRSEACA